MTNVHRNCFYAQALLPATITKCTLTSTPTLSPLRRHMSLPCALPGRKHSLTFHTLSSTFILGCIPVAELAASHLCRLTQEPISPPVSSPMHTHSVGIWVCTQSNNAYTDNGVFFPMVISHVCLWRTSKNKLRERRE